MRHRSNRGGWLPPSAPFLVVPGRGLRAPGDWNEVFGRAAPLVVEIGFGKDTFLLAEAQAHPERDHVGVERDPHRVQLFLHRAEERGLTNVRAMPVAGELALGVCFADASVTALHVYFPDPWPKERHELNRLVRPWFAREAVRVLVPGGRLHLATDDGPYHAQMERVLGVAELQLVDRAPPGGHATRFEQLWRERGRTIRTLTYSRRAGP